MPLLNLRKPGVSSTKWSSTIRLNMAPGSIWSRLNYPSWSVNVSVSVFPIWLPYNAKCPLGRSRAMLNALPFIGNFLLKMHAQNCPVFILHFPCVSLLVSTGPPPSGLDQLTIYTYYPILYFGNVLAHQCDLSSHLFR